MKTILVATFFLLLAWNLFSQEPAIQWQNTIGGTGEDQLNQSIQTSDGGYILAGYSSSLISGDKTLAGFGLSDYWVVKTDNLGVIVWQQVYGGSGDDKCVDIKQTPDGGFIIGGYSNSGISGNKSEANIGSNDYWILKTDASGNITWQNTIGGSGNDFLTVIIQTTDGGFIAGGYSGSGISGDKTEPSNGSNDYWIVKLNAAGSIVWQNGIGGSGADLLKSIKKTDDGGYIAGGNSTSPISGDKSEICFGGTDYWIVKLNGSGVVQWENTIGGTSDDQLNSVFQTTAGGFLLAGSSKSNFGFDKNEMAIDDDYLDYWILETDNAGNILWQQTIGGIVDDILVKTFQTADGGIIAAGYSNSDDNEDKLEPKIGLNDLWIMKLSATGNISWQNVIGGNNQDYFTSIQPTSDNGYIISAFSKSPISGDKTENVVGGGTASDYWIIKLAPDNCIPIPYYADIDEDLFGDPLNFRNACEIPEGFIVNNSDCNDNSTMTNSSKPEICDGDDNNCNGLIDEGIGACNPGPSIDWQGIIGGSAGDYLECVNSTADGGFIFGGNSWSQMGYDKTENSLGEDYWIVKTDAAGNVEWDNTISGTGNDDLNYVEQTQDGGYICIGYSWSESGADKTEGTIGFYGDADYWVIKLNAAGNIMWQNTIGGGHTDLGRVIHQLSDGSYIIGGDSYSGDDFDKTVPSYDVIYRSDYWIIKLNSFNAIVWQSGFGGTGEDYLADVIPTSDGGFLAAGSSNSPISGVKTTENVTGDCCLGNDSTDYWIVKMDANGIKQWEKTIGGGYSDVLFNVIQTDDGGFLLGGKSSSNAYGDKTMDSYGSSDYWVVKTDADGNIEWQTDYGSSHFEYFQNMRQADDGGYLLAGYGSEGAGGNRIEGSYGEHDYWIIKIDDIGNIIWQNVLGGSEDDEPKAFLQTPDGGYLVAGNSVSGIYAEKTVNNIDIAGSEYYSNDYWLVKFAPDCLPLDEICNTIDDNCNTLIDEDITETISISAGGPIIFCQGGNVILTATYSGTSVQWKKNGTNIAGATSSTYSVIKSGDYTCVTTSPCGTATSSLIHVTVNKNPAASITAGGATTFCAGGSVTLTEAAVAGSTYQWYKGAAAIGGATSTNYIATTAGNYKCRVTKTASGCFKNSNVIAVTVPCKDVEESVVNGEFDFTIYPNPNNGNFQISMDNINQNAVIEIYNSIGELIFTKQETSSIENISINNISCGIYFVRLINGINYKEQTLIIE
ncbi:MAG: T9SS type A sorting domain-containing protein [Chitinophagales bacterium]